MRKNNAFTLVEVIIVIVIFGIIATIGANIIARMYMNYIQARTVNYIQTQSGIVLEQIAKRLQYRVKASIVARKPDGTLYGLNDPRVNTDFDVIQWIGYSNEALLGNNAGAAPGWSGFIDLNNPLTSKTGGTLHTPGSNLVEAVNIMNHLSGGALAGTPAALIFKSLPDDYATPLVGYGWDGNGGSPEYMLRVTNNGNTDFNFDITRGTPTVIWEHYYLANSAYALVPNTGCGGCSNINFDLQLRYNYKPWVVGSTFNNADTAILARNVNLFRIKQTGSTIRLKLCLHDDGRSGLIRNNAKPVIACKEEVVL
jgi:prepilin-type N-terminal cleavage/methylation domain-containing protein